MPYRFRKTPKILMPGPTAMVSISVILPTISKCIEGIPHEIARAIRNAAPAARLPISAVCKALRTGRMPV